MIISASRRTDIPAYYGDWFMERIRAGWFRSVNPFNPRQVKEHSLAVEDVDAIVFWSKNPGPFLPRLDELDGRGYGYYFQLTLNDYARMFEPGLPPLDKKIEMFEALGGLIGPKRVLWRYDPIVVSSATPLSYHIEKISDLAGRLRGLTSRLTISFMDFYKKVTRRLNSPGDLQDVEFFDVEHEDERLAEFARAVQKAALDNGMKIFTCAEKRDLAPYGIPRGACVDGELISELFNPAGSFTRDKYQRKECLCSASVDVGAYDTCPAGCVYCYANANRKTVARNFKKRQSRAPSLL